MDILRGLQWCVVLTALDLDGHGTGRLRQGHGTGRLRQGHAQQATMMTSALQTCPCHLHVQGPWTCDQALRSQLAASNWWQCHLSAGPCPVTSHRSSYNASNIEACVAQPRLSAQQIKHHNECRRAIRTARTWQRLCTREVAHYRQHTSRVCAAIHCLGFTLCKRPHRCQVARLGELYLIS
jgi:hypothetical protein